MHPVPRAGLSRRPHSLLEVQTETCVGLARGRRRCRPTHARPADHIAWPHRALTCSAPLSGERCAVRTVAESSPLWRIPFQRTAELLTRARSMRQGLSVRRVGEGSGSSGRQCSARGRAFGGDLDAGAARHHAESQERQHHERCHRGVHEAASRPGRIQDRQGQPLPHLHRDWAQSPPSGWAHWPRDHWSSVVPHCM